MEEDNKEQPLRQEEGKNEEDRSEPSKNISEDHESETTKKVVFSLCYIWGILFFLPLVLYKDDKKATFHANQGLVLLLVAVCGNVIFGILTSFVGVNGMYFVGLMKICLPLRKGEIFFACGDYRFSRIDIYEFPEVMRLGTHAEIFSVFEIMNRKDRFYIKRFF